MFPMMSDAEIVELAADADVLRLGAEESIITNPAAYIL
jgi:hypothetical protein